MIAIVLISALISLAWFVGMFVLLANACGHLSRMEWNMRRLLAAVENDGQQAPPRQHSGAGR